MRACGCGPIVRRREVGEGSFSQTTHVTLMSTPAGEPELYEITREGCWRAIRATRSLHPPGLGISFPNRCRCRRGCAGVGKLRASASVDHLPQVGSPPAGTSLRGQARQAYSLSLRTE